MLQALILRNFRNYSSKVFEFGNETNLIIGDNGVGKTNLLEAIYLVSTGKSFITPQYSDLIQEGCDSFYVEAHFLKDEVPQSISIEYHQNGTKQLYHNRSIVKTFSRLIGILPSVFFTPKDESLISGTPTEKRRFLNIHLAQSDPMYVYHLVRYNQALKQRNSLLKLKKTQGIEAFEMILVSSGNYITQARKELITELNINLNTQSSQLSNNDEQYELNYKPSLKISTLTSVNPFEKTRNKELILGSTLIGVHRDDLFFTLKNRDAKYFASEGQKRTCLSGLKIAQWNHMASVLKLKPLFCVDDYLSHLDDQRVKLLQEGFQSLPQVFLTTPKKHASVDESTKVFEIKRSSQKAL